MKSGFEQFQFMDSTVSLSTHKRTKSDPMKRRVREEGSLDNITERSYQTNMKMEQLVEGSESKKRQCHNIDLQSSLTQEVQRLQKRLHQQFVVRCALEKASYLPFSQDAALENSIPMATKELIKEIGVLELEVVYLEQYLLSLYRKRFDQQMEKASETENKNESSSSSSVSGKGTICEKEISVTQNSLMSPRNSVGFPLKEFKKQLEPETVLDSSIHRTHSTLSHQSVCSVETSAQIQAKAVDSFHSLPLSMLEQAQSNTYSSSCLAEHLGSCFSDIVPETPNWLSEEMIKCISAIYCELADPPHVHHNASSPISFSSSVSEFSSRKKRVSRWKNHSAFNLNFNNIKGSKQLSGPYCSMLKIHRLCRDSEKLKEVEYMLRRFRSLVSRLEDVNPRNMEHEEKLAFWINVHNSLVMHNELLKKVENVDARDAFHSVRSDGRDPCHGDVTIEDSNSFETPNALLVYGISNNNAKRMSSVLKAAYNIGGHKISVDLIQNFILRCRLPRPGQWLQILFPARTKFKDRDARKAYAIHRPESSLLFALSAGSHSDPAVRLYTSKRVMEELESAKEEYIQSTISVIKEQKIIVPKIVEFFSKNSGLSVSGLMEMVKTYLPESQRKIFQEVQPRASWKGIEFIPHNFTFHYLISQELAW